MRTPQQFEAEIKAEIAEIHANYNKKMQLLDPRRRGGVSKADLKEIKRLDRDSARRKNRVRFIRDAKIYAERVPEEAMRETLRNLQSRIETWHRRAESLFDQPKARNAYLQENGVRQLEAQVKNLIYILN